MTKITKLLLTLFVLLTVTAPAAFAGVETPTSMLDSGVESIIADFGADLVPTVLAIFVIVVPVGLGVWAIGFGLYKGIGYLKRQTRSAI